MPILLAMIVLALFASLAGAQQATPYKAEVGAWRVDVIDAEWTDASRLEDGAEREVLVRLYVPRAVEAGAAAERHPVVVFSHGMGGSRDGYEYIGRHLASHGYLMVHPQHAGSDTPALRELARESRRRGERNRVAGVIDDGTSDPDNLVGRPLDVSFVLDRLLKDEHLAPLADMERVAVAGHSFGAYTALAAAGMRVHVPSSHGGPVRTFGDPRVKAAIAMSPQGPGVMGIESDSWAPITVPVLLITGSKDMGQGERAVEWRLTPFEKITSKGTQLLYIDEATHMTFSGANSLRALVKGGPRSTVERHLGYIRQTCTAFLDATLHSDVAARSWLQSRAIEELSGKECELRSRASGGRDNAAPGMTESPSKAERGGN